MPGQNYFAVCDRDKEGHCLPRGTRDDQEGEGDGMSSDEASKQRLKDEGDETEEMEVESPEFDVPAVQPTGPCIGVWVGHRHRIGSLFVGTDGMLHPEGNLASILMQPPEVLLEFLMGYSGVTLHFKPEAPPEVQQPMDQSPPDEMGGDDQTETTDGQMQEDSPAPAGEEQIGEQGEEGGDEEGPPRRKGKALPRYQRKSHGLHPDVYHVASAMLSGNITRSEYPATAAALHDALLEHGHDDLAKAHRHYGPLHAASVALGVTRPLPTYDAGDRVKMGSNTGTIHATPEQTGYHGSYHVHLDGRPDDEVAVLHGSVLHPHGKKALPQRQTKSQPSYHHGRLIDDGNGGRLFSYPTGSGGLVQEPVRQEDIDYGDLVHHDAYTNAIHAGLGRESATQVAEHARHHATMAGHHHSEAAVTGDEHRLALVDFHMDEIDRAREEPWHAAGHASEHDGEKALQSPHTPEHHAAIIRGHAAAASREVREREHRQRLIEKQAQDRQRQQMQQDGRLVPQQQQGEKPQIGNKSHDALLPEFRSRRKLLPEMEKMMSSVIEEGGGALRKPPEFMGPRPQKKRCKGKVEDDDADWLNQQRQKKD